jgi:hypothetical protein
MSNIPMDDIALQYGAADDLRKGVVTHILSDLEGQMIAAVQDRKAGNDGSYWVVSNLEPQTTVPVIAMLAEKMTSLYGTSWLYATFQATLASVIPDKNERKMFLSGMYRDIDASIEEPRVEEVGDED